MVERAPTESPGPHDVLEELEQLRRDRSALEDQLRATSEVLEALGRSAADPETVLRAIVESARRLCRSDAAHIYLNEDGVYRLITSVGLSEETIRFIADHPMPVDRGTLIGRVGLERRPLQIADVLADADYGRHDLQRVAGFRTTMGAPLLLDDEVVGALALWRTEVAPFDDRALAIVSAFAGQAAMAVNGVKLVQQLASKVDQLEALRAVGEAVSSSLDVDDVLDTIAEHAVAMSGAEGGSIMEYDDAEGCFVVRSVCGTAPDVVERLRSVRIDLEDTLVGRATRERRPLAVAELGTTALDPHLQVLYDDGWRSLVAVPMVREGQVVGCLVVRRRATGGFPDDTVDLLETFASQSALALLNARLYGELQEQSVQLEVAGRHKSEFLASMSHELRTPLNAVLGFSEVLLERMFGDINERQEEYLRDIHGSGKHLLELLNEILDLSKVEAGRMELEPSPVLLGELLDEVVGMVRDRAQAGGVDVRLEGPTDLGLLADRLRLKQVVLNLVTNAVKFTESGGTVVVRTEQRPHEVAISVSDTGVGVPEEDRERIFESFQQGGRGAAREEGTGLGLTLSRRLVELMGGRMWLESEVGVGSTFGFTLPSRVPANDHPSYVGHLVVIEDDRPSLDLITAYAAGASLRVTPARDGQAGLDAVRRYRPDAVVLDLRLPGVDGWTVLQALKADPATSDIPVVVVSVVNERARGVSLGASEYLVKPVSRDALLGALARLGAPPLAGARGST